AGAGFGINVTSFNVDPEDALAASLEGVDIEVDNTWVVGFEAGVDYFVTPEVSISLDGRFLYSQPSAVATLNGVEIAGATGDFKAQNISIMLGLKYWFELY
ncbi:MAG: hypothetical protein JRJ59_11690, partial [Deltaproteobacteria bacterium]|nr:hypothetical protein [Deltaproteobacteria bacterium]